MIRERRLGSNNLTYSSGAVQTIELPKDAVYHQLQLLLSGSVSSVNGAGASANSFAEGFPFNLIARLRLVRNGSDVVWQGSGKQLAKEMLYLNGRYPFARVWNGTSTSTTQTLLTKTINAVVIPANSEGIGSNAAVFQDAGTASVTLTTNFRALLEIWLQLGVDDSYFATLLDARPLASYVLEVTWDTTANILVAGSNAVPTISASLQVMSYDQDNVDLGQSFGTFKRASITQTTFAWNTSQNQLLLPRGNFYYGIIFEALSAKSAAGNSGATALTSIPQPGDDIIGEIQNRINSNYLLRDIFFQDLQAKNRDDQLLPSSGFDTNSGGPLGWACLNFCTTGKSVKELVPTYTMDQFDLLVNTNPQSPSNDNNTYTSANPIVNVLTMEVIPGRSVAPNMPQGAFAGSSRATSAKPGA